VEMLAGKEFQTALAHLQVRSFVHLIRLFRIWSSRLLLVGMRV
jgi:hypothetical protein